MNHTLTNYVLCMALTVPLMTDCMLISLARRAVSSRVLQRGCFSTTLPKQVDRKRLCERLICDCNRQIENLIWDATEHPERESVCAENIGQLLATKVAKADELPCCLGDSLHLQLAILGKKNIIAGHLLDHNPQLVHMRDINGSLPIDIVRDNDKGAIGLLKRYNSPEKSLCSHVLRSVRVPDHGWLKVNDIVRACMLGSVDEVMKITQRRGLNAQQKKELIDLAYMCYWRYGEPVFLKIICFLETGFLQKGSYRKRS